MSILKPMTGGVKYLRFGARGYEASGKTFTAVLLACALKRHYKMEGPIVCYDTEGGIAYVREIIKDLTGEYPIGVRSRTLKDLLATIKEAEKAGACCHIADSVTHPWRNLCDSHLAAINKSRERKRLAPRSGLVMSDWMALKQKWAKYTDAYINAPMHTFMLGRAGLIYKDVENEETGQIESKVTGEKMKTETESGFEPSLGISMEAFQDPAKGKKLFHKCTITKDRSNKMDGMSIVFPPERDPEVAMNRIFTFFKPHIDFLDEKADGNTVDTKLESMKVSAEGQTDWQREKQRRMVFCEEIKGALQLVLPGQSAAEKKKRAQLLQAAFGTTSWTKVENTKSAVLAEGLEKLKGLLEDIDDD